MVQKESLLDHVYVNNPASVNDVLSVIPTFGDHALVTVKLNLLFKPEVEIIQKRNWRGYSVPILNAKLAAALVKTSVNWPLLSVQEHWNSLEMILINCTDECAPIVKTKLHTKKSVNEIPTRIKSLLNLRKRFLRLDHSRFNTAHAPRIRALNKEVNSKILAKGHEPVLCEAQRFCWSFL